jgi:hypothetical protein
VSNTLEAIAKAVCEIVGREDLPLGSSVVRLLLLGYSVGCKIPHLGVSACDVLLHAEESGLRLVFSIMHVLELLEICLDILFGMLASITGTLLSFLSTALELNLGLITMADVGLLLLDELLGEIEELLEVVA